MHPDISLSYGPGHAKMCLIPYANNKGAEQVFSNGTIVTLWCGNRELNAVLVLYDIYTIGIK